MIPYELNRFMYDLAERERREAFQEDPHAFLDGYELTADERRLIEERDWSALLDRDVSVYILANMASAVGLTLVDVGARFRGQTLEQFAEFIRAQNERVAEFAIVPEESIHG